MEILERKFAPAIKQIEKIDIIKASHVKLDNGISVYSVNAGQQDLIKIEFAIKNNYLTAEEVFTSSSVNRMLAEGTRKHTAQELADAVDYFGAFYETEEGTDYNSVCLYTLKKHFEKTLPIVREVLTQPTFPKKELSIFKQNAKQRLKVNQEKVGYLSRTRFNEILFGKENPYGYSVDIPVIEKLAEQDLSNYYNKCYNLNQLVIIVSGKIDDFVFKIINEQFGKEKILSSDTSQVDHYASNPSAEKRHFVNKKGAVQSSIRIGRLLFNKAHPDYLKLTLLNTVLGGYFGSRLMSNIREDKGYTYGISSSVVSLFDSGYWVISTEVGKDVCENAMNEIKFELEQLKKTPIPSDELQMVKNYMTGNLLKSMDGASNLADRWKGIMFYGLDYNFYQNYFATIQDTNAQQLLELANKYILFESFYELAVGEK